MIYAVYCKEYDKLKIGFSIDPEKRLTGLTTSHWSELKLAFYEEGTLDEEQFIHNLLKAYNIRGEWYNYKEVSHLLPYIFNTWNKTDCIHNLITVKENIDLNKKIGDYVYGKKSALNKLELQKKPKYQEILKAYLDLVKETKNRDLTDYEVDLINNKINLIEKHYSDFKKALTMLGETKLHALRYQKSLIRQEIIKLDGKKGIELKVVELLNFKNGDFITLADLKTKLKTIYTELDLDSIVTAKEIENYYKIKAVVKRLNGKHTKGYEILYPLFQQ